MTAALSVRPDTWADVEAARDGDRAAFGLIWQAHHTAVFAFVHSRVRHRADAEEITSEAFLRALRRIDGIEWRGVDIRAWLYTIARNVVADHFKSARVRTTDLRETLTDLDWVDPFDLAHEVTKSVTDRWAATQLRRAMAELTPPQRRCIQLRYAHGLTVPQTAADLVAVPRQRVTSEGVRAA